MQRVEHACLMAQYNQWMNSRLYEAAMRLSPDELSADRNAFFGSIIGTLNHLVVADTIWLKRFAAHPANFAALQPIMALPTPERLNQLLFTDIHALAEHRNTIDGVIKAWTASMTEQDLDHVLQYANMRGNVFRKNFYSLVMHLFNHQTHHRGQTTTLLFQAGVDPGVTDLMMIIPDQP